MKKTVFGLFFFSLINHFLRGMTFVSALLFGIYVWAHIKLCWARTAILQMKYDPDDE